MLWVNVCFNNVTLLVKQFPVKHFHEPTRNLFLGTKNSTFVESEIKDRSVVKLKLIQQEKKIEFEIL